MAGKREGEMQVGNYHWAGWANANIFCFMIAKSRATWCAISKLGEESCETILTLVDDSSWGLRRNGGCGRRRLRIARLWSVRCSVCGNVGVDDVGLYLGKRWCRFWWRSRPWAERRNETRSRVRSDWGNGFVDVAVSFEIVVRT